MTFLWRHYKNAVKLNKHLNKCILLRIYFRLWECKICQNRLRFARVVNKNLQPRFYAPPCSSSEKLEFLICWFLPYFTGLNLSDILYLLHLIYTPILRLKDSSVAHHFCWLCDPRSDCRALYWFHAPGLRLNSAIFPRFVSLSFSCMKIQEIILAFSR